MRARWTWAATLAAAAGTALLYLPLCDLVFQCGCTWPFLGAAAHCNMHHAQPPHCPLCAGHPLHGALFGLGLFGALLAPLWLLTRRLARLRS